MARVGWLLGLGGASLLAAAPTPRTASSLGLQLGPDTTVITEPLNAAGYPDYIAALNARLSAGVAREENFWVLMWPAIGNAERSREEYIREVERRLGIQIGLEPRMQELAPFAGLTYNTPDGDRVLKQQSEAMSRPWTRDEFPVIARWIDVHEPLMAEVHEACLRPKAFTPLIGSQHNEPGLMVGILLPHVQALRDVARLLAARSMLRLAEGDVEGAWQDLLDLERLAGHSEQGWSLIEQLVGYAIRGMAQGPLGHWVAGCGLTADQLDLRRAALAPLLKSCSLALSIDSERFMYLDTVTALVSGGVSSREAAGLIEPNLFESDSDGDSADAADQLRSARLMAFQVMLLNSDVNATLRYGNRMYDDLVKAMQPATHLERQALLRAIDERVARNARIVKNTAVLATTYLFGSREDVQAIPGRVLTGLLMPAITSVEIAYTRSEAYAGLVESAFAAQAFVVRNHRLPASLAELGSEAAGFTTDPFDNQPLRMRVDDRGLMLYSVGRNGRDDGGRTSGEGDDCDDVRIILPLAP